MRRITARLRGLLGRGLPDAPRLTPSVPVPEEDVFPRTLVNALGEGDPNASHVALDLEPVTRPLLSPEEWGVLEQDVSAGEYSLPRGGSGRRRLAFLGSAELLRELAFDADVIVPGLEDWSETLSPDRVGYLLVETSWEVAGGDWRFGLVGQGPGRAEVEALLGHCRRRGVPVVVWFRVDPGDVGHFAWLAGAADLAYAVDAGVVDALQAEFPDTRCAHLPVAIQPAIHNPLRGDSVAREANALDKSVLFDGWWDLLAGMRDQALLRELNQCRQLLVGESEWDYANIHLADCPEFAPAAVGVLSPVARLGISRLCMAEVFPGDGVNAQWREAQRMLRAAASGCLPLASGPGETLVKDAQVPLRGDAGELLSVLQGWSADPMARARHAQLVLRALLADHCLAHRLRRIEQDLGIDVDPQESKHPAVACVLVTRRPELVEKCIAWFRRDRYPNKELIVIAHGVQHGVDAGESAIGAGERIRVFRMGANQSLGTCLNFGIALSDAPYWAKIDDDDFYGDHYLSDLMSYRAIRDFDVIGKPPQFLYLESGDELRWDQGWHSHSWILHTANGPRAVQLAGGTLLGRRDAWDKVRFSTRRRRGSDTDFVLRCYEHGYDVMVADGFNFARFRSAQPGFHTWNVDDAELRARSVSIGARDLVSSAAFC